MFYTVWQCLSESEGHHIDLICDGAFNTDTEAYACCSDGDNCNKDIIITLPTERKGSVSTVSLTATTTGGSGQGSSKHTLLPESILTMSSSPSKTRNVVSLPAPTSVYVLQSPLVLLTTDVPHPTTTPYPSGKFAREFICHLVASLASIPPHGEGILSLVCVTSLLNLLGNHYSVMSHHFLCLGTHLQ